MNDVYEAVVEHDGVYVRIMARIQNEILVRVLNQVQHQNRNTVVHFHLISDQICNQLEDDLRKIKPRKIK